jgi:hypothetical protein
MRLTDADRPSLSLVEEIDSARTGDDVFTETVDDVGRGRLV